MNQPHDTRSVAAALGDAENTRYRATEALTAAYQAVFDGNPSRDDQAMVKNDLSDFCGMRTAMLRGTFHETAQAVGMFRVWQRIDAFRFPRAQRPPDVATLATAIDGPLPPATPGGGVAEHTED